MIIWCRAGLGGVGEDPVLEGDVGGGEALVVADGLVELGLQAGARAARRLDEGVVDIIPRRHHALRAEQQAEAAHALTVGPAGVGGGVGVDAGEEDVVAEELLVGAVDAGEDGVGGEAVAVAVEGDEEPAQARLVLDARDEEVAGFEELAADVIEDLLRHVGAARLAEAPAVDEDDGVLVALAVEVLGEEEGVALAELGVLGEFAGEGGGSFLNKED